MGEVSAVAEETFSLTLRNGKTLTLYYSETLSPAERALIAPGARVQVAVDPVIDGRPEVVKVRTPKP